MSVRMWAAGVLTLSIAATATWVVAQDAASATPTTEPTTRVRLPRDFAELTDLSDDQKSQILSIRQTTDSQIRELEAKEKADESAILTDTQKAELADIDKKIGGERRAREEAARRQEEIENTQDKLNQLKSADQPTTNPAAQN